MKRAIEVARHANDALAAEVRKRPNRFAAFAALPMQDPQAASAELTRCVRELGFVGALVNGFSQAVGQGCEWFDKAEVGEADRAKIGHDNAVKLFKLNI